MDGFLLPHSLEHDAREPVFTFAVTLPGFLQTAMRMVFGANQEEDHEHEHSHEHGHEDNHKPEHEYEYEYEIGFLVPSVGYWIELLGLLVATLSIAAILGFVLYKTVVAPKKAGTPVAYLVGWGLVLPFWVCWPLVLLATVDIRNAIFRFLVGGIAPIVCSFRTTEAIYGFCPECVTKSAADFCFYYATVPIVARRKQMDADVDTKMGSSSNSSSSSSNSTTAALAVGDPIPCSNSKKLKHLGTFLGLLFLTGVWQSILSSDPHFNIFQTAGGIAINPTNYHDGSRYGTWQLYANSAVQAMLFQMYLGTYCEALTFAFAVVTGKQAEPVMDNPLLRSKSPMEFWGKRWNTMIHTVLKNGIYKPLRKIGIARNVAVLVTFLSSGAFHEWIVALVFVFGDANVNGDSNSGISTSSHRVDTYAPRFGGSMVFFVWQALLIGLELAMGDTRWGKRLTNYVRVPRPVKTVLVIAMGIPLAHFFLEPYTMSGFFFDHGRSGLPMWTVVS